MLCELNISNFVIIENQTISFGDGLNVISGETGSGKSIVLQALELILGGRSKPRYIRKGADSWEIQALFRLDNIPRHIFDELPDIVRHDELVVSRSMNSAGRGKVYINGRLGTVSLLEEITRKIINICSQGQHVRLLDPKYHLELVDGFAGCREVLERYQDLYRDWKEADSYLQQLREKAEQNLLRRAELEFLVEELGAINLYPGVRQGLEAEVQKNSNAEALIRSANNISEQCNEESGLFANLGSIGSELGELEKVDGEGISEILELFHSAQAQLQELDGSLNDYVSKIDINEAKLEELRERLAELARLERKYKTDDEGLQKLLELAQAELVLFDNVENIDALAKEVEQKLAKAAQCAKELTRLRKAAARRLASSVQAELGELNMIDAQLSNTFEKCELGPKGQDRVEICIATNKGEPARPLRQIASGGELSRIMLVLKKVLREQSGVNVLIFDEVDSGVSGPVARAVGHKLKALAEQSQVVCITHLAQVASLAKHHFLVDKKVGARTKSVISELTEQEKVDEIARMLAGYKITSASRESARELLSSKH
ncbi:DNA repair protein RecN [Oligoflexia bacterium]|nr:DNA repair protein RecN [Oligoflexia bacterium]